VNIDYIIYQNNEIHDYFIEYLKEGNYICYDVIWYNNKEINPNLPVCVLKPQTNYYVLNEIYLENRLLASFTSFNIPYDDKITYGGKIQKRKMYKGGKNTGVPEDIAIIDKMPENKEEIKEEALEEYKPISMELQSSFISKKSTPLAKSKSKTISKSKSKSSAKSKSRTAKRMTP